MALFSLHTGNSPSFHLMIKIIIMVIIMIIIVIKMKIILITSCTFAFLVCNLSFL